MRMLTIGLLLLWATMMATYLGIQEYPDETEIAAKKLAMLSNSIGMNIPTETGPYEAIALMLAFLAPTLLFLITALYARKIRKMHDQLRLSSREQIAARTILKELGISIEDAERTVAETANADEIFSQLAQLRTRTEEARHKLREKINSHTESIAPNTNRAAELIHDLSTLQEELKSIRDPAQGLQQKIQEANGIFEDIETDLENLDIQGSLSSLSSIREQLKETQESIQNVEKMLPEATELLLSIQGLKDRLDKTTVNGRTPQDLVEDCQTNMATLEESIEEIENDENFEEFPELQRSMPAIVERIVAIENLSPIILQTQSQLDSLMRRLETADGNSMNSLVDFAESISEDISTLNERLTTLQEGLLKNLGPRAIPLQIKAS